VDVICVIVLTDHSTRHVRASYQSKGGPVQRSNYQDRRDIHGRLSVVNVLQL
jgi:hypothetical protein